MFAFLRGVVASKGVNRLALDVNGVGFEVLAPDSVLNRISIGEEATLLTYCHIREDSFQIFGFLSEKEKSMFTMCLGINGIGPKVALGLLSVLSVEALARAIHEQDIAAVSRAPGVGKRLAGRIILEMKTKMGEAPELSALLGAPDAGAIPEGDDVFEALISLGCTPAEAKKAAAHARGELGDAAPDAELVRVALRSLAKVTHVQR